MTFAGEKEGGECECECVCVCVCVCVRETVGGQHAETAQGTAWETTRETTRDTTRASCVLAGLV